MPECQQEKPKEIGRPSLKPEAQPEIGRYKPISQKELARIFERYRGEVGGKKAAVVKWQQRSPYFVARAEGKHQK